MPNKHVPEMRRENGKEIEIEKEKENTLRNETVGDETVGSYNRDKAMK